MKITFTAPNRLHHYPYMEALHKIGHLYAFVSGFSRFSPRSALPIIGDKLKRQDFFQNMYIASLKSNAPYAISSRLNLLSNSWLDHSSYQWANKSDVFIYYRTQGRNTTVRLHKEGNPVVCVLEEVNSHVDVCNKLMHDEFRKLNVGEYTEKFPDHKLRLKAYEEADYILCPSEFVRQSFMSKGFTADRLIKVNFGFTTNNVVQKAHYAKKDDTFRILFVGQLHYRKGLRYAIEAFRQLKHPKKEFVIVGPKTLITGLENIKIPDGVVFTGPLKGEFLTHQYNIASVFVLPSIEEGLALVQGEALAHGLPLLITTNTGGEDLITEGKEGFIVPVAQVLPLAQKLQEMANDKVLLERMATAALKTAQSLGSWDSSASKLILELSKKIKLYNA